MRTFSLLFTLLVLAASGCGTTTTPPAKTAKALSWTIDDLITEAKNKGIQAGKTTERDTMKTLATEGLTFAQQCLERAPEEAGCYYYRAVNTGFYYQAHVIGYQVGVKQMIEDLNRVMRLDPDYDYAGAYRMLGQLYTKLPQTATRSESIVRNLEKAEENLSEASRLAPDYPENHLALAEAFIAQGKFAPAVESLARAKQLVPQWQRNASYSEWQVTAQELEREVAKRTN